MRETIINELNAILKGEHMAIGAYERYIQEIRDDKLKKELQQIQQDHKRHSEELSSRVQVLGGNAKNSTGFTGAMASVMGTLQGMGGRADVDILKNAYDGEDKGIAMAEEIVKGDLDDESRQMVERMMKEDHNHLSRMAHLISDMEG